MRALLPSVLLLVWRDLWLNGVMSTVSGTLVFGLYRPPRIERMCCRVSLERM